MTGERVYKVLGSGEENGFRIDSDFVQAVENAVGMGSGAWDTIDPEAICAAAIQVFLTRYEVKEQ
jgi:hypothetical protein